VNQIMYAVSRQYFTKQVFLLLDPLGVHTYSIPVQIAVLYDLPRPFSYQKSRGQEISRGGIGT